MIQRYHDYKVPCTAVSPNLSTYRTEPYLNQTLKTDFAKTPRQKLKVNYDLIERDLFYKNINSLLISIEEFLRNWSSKFD